MGIFYDLGVKMTLTDKEIEGLFSEIVSCKCLFPKSDEDRAYNQGMDKAINFIKNYKDGKGLFQIPDGEKS